MRDTHIEAVKARQMYLTDAEKSRFPFLPEPVPKIGKQSTKVKSQEPADSD